MKKCYLFGIGLLLFVSSNIAFGQDGNGHAGWHKIFNDSLQGTRSDEALQYLEARQKSATETVIVGLIDTGIDTTATDLRPALWNNPKEIADGKDNDQNGYVDDLHGWNFLGTKDGTFNMGNAGTEEYREFKRLYPKYKNLDPAQVQDKEALLQAGFRAVQCINPPDTPLETAVRPDFSRRQLAQAAFATTNAFLR